MQIVNHEHRQRPGMGDIEVEPYEHNERASSIHFGSFAQLSYITVNMTEPELRCLHTKLTARVAELDLPHRVA